MVLRFLAEDVGKELDLVLDSVLPTVGRRAEAVPPTPLPLIRRN
jgi:hypothetical protein